MNFFFDLILIFYCRSFKIFTMGAPREISIEGGQGGATPGRGAPKNLFNERLP